MSENEHLYFSLDVPYDPTKVTLYIDVVVICNDDFVAAALNGIQQPVCPTVHLITRS